MKLSDHIDVEPMDSESAVETQKPVKKVKKKQNKGKEPAVQKVVAKKAEKTAKKEKIRHHLVSKGLQDGSSFTMSDGTEAVINLSVGGHSIASKKTGHRVKNRVDEKKVGPIAKSIVKGAKRERDHFYTHDSATAIVISGLHELATNNKKLKRSGVPIPGWMLDHLSIDQMDWILGRLSRTGYSEPEFSMVPNVGLCLRWKGISSH